MTTTAIVAYLFVMCVFAGLTYGFTRQLYTIGTLQEYMPRGIPTLMRVGASVGIVACIFFAILTTHLVAFA